MGNLRRERATLSMDHVAGVCTLHPRSATEAILAALTGDRAGASARLERGAGHLAASEAAALRASYLMDRPSWASPPVT
jgi:hypothetical protein